MMDTPTYVHTVAAQAQRYLLAFWDLSGSANSEIVRLAYKTEHAYPILYEIYYGLTVLQAGTSWPLLLLMRFSKMTGESRTRTPFSHQNLSSSIRCLQRNHIQNIVQNFKKGCHSSTVPSQVFLLSLTINFYKFIQFNICEFYTNVLGNTFYGEPNNINKSHNYTDFQELMVNMFSKQSTLCKTEK